MKKPSLAMGLVQERNDSGCIDFFPQKEDEEFMQNTMKLYYAARTRSVRPRWLLEELGLPYDIIQIDLKTGQQKTEEYKKIHPLGKVPALTDGATTLYESVGICTYLADKYIEKGFAPALEDPKRALYYQWLFFGTTTLEPPVMDCFKHRVLLPQEQRSEAVFQKGAANFEKFSVALDKTLNNQTYLVGDVFTTADIVMGTILDLASSLKLLETKPILMNYLQNLKTRPAYKKARQD